jgi:hypothetical protein
MWCSKLQYGEDSCALFWLKQFYHFNKDLLKEYKFLNRFKETLEKMEANEWSDKKGCSEIQGQIMDAISSQKETKVVTKTHNLISSFTFWTITKNFLK